MRPLTIGSLFSGLGGMEKGLLDAGLGPVLFQVEIEPFCRAILAKHWPEVKRYEDVCKVTGLPGPAAPGKEVREELSTVDVICGGFP
jgi:DNA (cytosine-5)-methyltransferase 1